MSGLPAGHGSFGHSGDIHGEHLRLQQRRGGSREGRAGSCCIPRDEPSGLASQHSCQTEPVRRRYSAVYAMPVSSIAWFACCSSVGAASLGACGCSAAGAYVGEEKTSAIASSVWRECPGTILAIISRWRHCQQGVFPEAIRGSYHAEAYMVNSEQSRIVLDLPCQFCSRAHHASAQSSVKLELIHAQTLLLTDMTS